MFKKKIFCLLMSAFCMFGTVFCMHVPVGVLAGTNVQVPWKVQAAETHPVRVIDDADLLMDSEEEELLMLVDEISERQQFDVVILAVDSLDGEDIQDFSADYYDYNGYGMGENYDGAMFTISMQEREWYILTTGTAIDILTDSDLDDMADEIIPYLSDGEYAQAFTEFAQMCDAEITYALNEDTTEAMYTDDGEESSPGIIVSLLIGLVLAFVPVLTMRGKLKSVKMQTSAGNYEKSGSRKLTIERDVFLYHTVNRVPKPKEDESHSEGGSTTFRSSSGRSHGGRGGGF